MCRVRDAADVTGWGLCFTPHLCWPGAQGDIMRKDLTNEKAEYLRLLPAALLRQYADGIGPQTAEFRRGMKQQLGITLNRE